MARHDDYTEIKKVYSSLLKDLELEESSISERLQYESQSDRSLLYRIPLTELIYRLIEKIKYIVLIAIIVGAIAWALSTYVIDPKYSATAKIYVLNKDDTSMSLSDIQVGSYLAADYIQVFYNKSVHEQVRENLNLNYTNSELESMLTIKNPSDTRILNITVTSESPEEAYNMANEYSKVARQFIMTTLSPLIPQQEYTDDDGVEKEPEFYCIANEFESASMPTDPTSPNIIRNTLIGFVIGAFVSLIFFGLQIILDNRIRTAEDLENYLGIPSLGLMPLETKDKSKSEKQTAKKA